MISLLHPAEILGHNRPFFKWPAFPAPRENEGQKSGVDRGASPAGFLPRGAEELVDVALVVPDIEHIAPGCRKTRLRRSRPRVT